MKPASIEEAVATIQAEFPEEKLKKWAELPEGEACAQAHFKLGLWIRNEWVYGSDCILVDEMREQKQFIHNDDVSGVVVKALWQVLNGQPCPSIKEL